MKDKLNEMFEMQEEMQTNTYGTGVSPRDFDTEKKIDFLKTNVLALADEQHELLAEMGWKPWATSRHINVESARSEIIDAWHFLMNQWITLGGTPEGFHMEYISKNKKNKTRQSEGYDGVTGKCGNCGRAYDDSGVLRRINRQTVECLCGDSFTRWAKVDATYAADFVLADSTAIDEDRLLARLERSGLGHVDIEREYGDRGRSGHFVVKCSYSVRGNWPRDIEVKVGEALAEQGIDVPVHARTLAQNIHLGRV